MKKILILIVLLNVLAFMAIRTYSTEIVDGIEQTLKTDGTPVANDIPRFTDGVTLGGLSYAEFLAALDLQTGTDFYSKSAVDTWRASCTVTEMGYLYGVTSAIQTQIDGKQATVTEGSLADRVVVGADMKLATILAENLATTLRRTTQTVSLNDAGVLTPTASYWINEIAVTGNDNPTTFTINEASASDGQIIIITNASANPIKMIDVAGQQELPSSVTLAQTEKIIFIYETDRWIETGRVTNALTFKTLTTTETEYLPISYAVDGASAPDALETITSGTDKVDVRTFQPAADEDVLITWQVPQDIDATSGIKFRVIMFVTHATGPSSEVVSFELAGFSLGDGDALNGTLGTVQAATLAASSHVQYDRIATAFSSALTSTHITDLSVDGETIIFKLNRDSGVASDYEQVIGVAGLELKYKRLHDATF